MSWKELLANLQREIQQHTLGKFDKEIRLLAGNIPPQRFTLRR
jgi:hypothetical protein